MKKAFIRLLRGNAHFVQAFYCQTKCFRKRAAVSLWETCCFFRKNIERVAQLCLIKTFKKRTHAQFLPKRICHFLNQSQSTRDEFVRQKKNAVLFTCKFVRYNDPLISRGICSRFFFLFEYIIYIYIFRNSHVDTFRRFRTLAACVYFRSVLALLLHRDARVRFYIILIAVGLVSHLVFVFFLFWMMVVDVV